MDLGSIAAPIIGGAASAGGGLVSDALGNRAARKERQNAQAWEAQRYQTAARDMQAAGLNRILALGSPASNVGQANVGFSDMGSNAVAGATAAQNITESQTRKTLNAATEQAAISSAKAADAKAKLDEETANKIREMLPGEKDIQSKTSRGMDRAYDIQGVEKRLKELDLSKEEFYKKIYEKLGPMADKLMERISPFLTNALEGTGDGVSGLVNALTSSGVFKDDSEKYGSFMDFLLSPGKWNWTQGIKSEWDDRHSKGNKK